MTDGPVSWIDYCLAKPGAWRDEPWEGDPVAKIEPRIFAFVQDSSVGAKCGTREEADEWLLRYPDAATTMAYIGRHGRNSLRTGGPDASPRRTSPKRSTCPTTWCWPGCLGHNARSDPHSRARRFGSDPHPRIRSPA